jgi:hypothetical protein
LVSGGQGSCRGGDLLVPRRGELLDGAHEFGVLEPGDEEGPPVGTLLVGADLVSLGAGEGASAGRLERGTGVPGCVAGTPGASGAYEQVRSILESLGMIEVRTSRSLVAFRRYRDFAYVWMPGRWLSNPTAEVVLSIALGQHMESPTVHGRRAPDP